MPRKTLYCLMDTETTKKNGLVFDFAYDLHDRHGTTFAKGSFLIKDVMAIEEPYFKEKIAEYWTLAYKGKVKPLSMAAIRRHFNTMLRTHLNMGYKIVLCAYNALFDITHLGMTCQELTKQKFLTPENTGVYFLDLWHAWSMGCPEDYGWTAPWTRDNPGELNPKTGKPYPWNIKTSAETVYRYLVDNPSFVERHIAFEDLFIEKIILQDVINRKQKMPIVSKPSEFVSMPWKIVQERCRIPIETRKNKQLSILPLVADISEQTIEGSHLSDSLFLGLEPTKENMEAVAQDVLTKVALLNPLDSEDDYT